MSYNVVINLGGEPWQMHALEGFLRGEEGENKVRIINLKPEDLHRTITEEEKKIFGRVDSLSKIYIVDHGKPNSASITSGHYSEVANYLERRVNKETLQMGKQRLHIDLISCNTAIGNDKGFAGLFHRYLGQVHHIDSEVVARTKIAIVNAHSLHKGVLTESILGYTGRLMAYELGFKSFARPNPDDHFQQPGSSVTFKWTQDGNEAMIDTHIDMLSKKALALKNEVIEQLKKEDISLDVVPGVIRDVNKLVKLSYNSEKIDQKKVDKICALTEKIKTEMTSKKISNAKINSLAADLLKFRKDSINDESIDPTIFKSNIHQRDTDIKDPSLIVKKEIIDPIRTEFKRIPEDIPQKQSLRASSLQLSNHATHVAAFRMKHDHPIDREVRVGNFIKSTFAVINSTQMSKEKKIIMIESLKQSILREIKDEVLLSHSLKGAVEGFEQSMNYGGLTTLKNLFPMMTGFSKLENDAVNAYFEEIEQFASEAINFVNDANYAGFTPGTPEDQIRVEASKIANFGTHVINDAISTNTKVLVQLLEDDNKNVKTKANNELRKAIAVISKTEDNLNKLKFSIANSPDQKVKDIYEAEAIQVIEGRLNDLKKVKDQLETELQ